MNKNIKEQTKIRANTLSFGEGLRGALRNYITLIIILTAIVANAQFYTQIDFGYNLPIYKKTNDFVNITMYKSTKERVKAETTEQAKLSIVKGINFGITGGYILKNKFQFEMGINYFNSNKFPQNNNSVIFDSLYVDEWLNIDRSYKVQKKKEQTFSSEILTINPNVSYLKNINKFSFNFTLGLLVQKVKVFSEFNSSKSWFDWSNSELEYSYEYDSLYKYEYASHYYLNLYAGIGLAYNFTKNISAVANISMPITNTVYSTSSDTKTQYYSKLTYKEGTNPNEETVVEDNEKHEVNNPNDYKFYSRAINFSIGVRYSFGNKK